MIASRIYRSLPGQFRRRSLWVSASIMLSSLLDLVGIATLFPLLVLIAKPEAAMENAVFLKVYHTLGVADLRSFTIITGFAVVGVLIIKNLLTAVLNHGRTRYLTRLYNYFADKLFSIYYSRGLLFIKQRNTSDLTYNISSQCYNYVWGLMLPLLSMLGGIIIIVVMLTVFLVISPKATLLLMVCIIPIGLLYTTITRQRIEEYGREDFRARREQMRSVLQALRAYPEVEIAGAFTAIQARFRSNLEKISRNRLRYEDITRVPSGVMEAGIALCIVLMLVVNPSNMLVTLTLFGFAAIRMLPAMRQLISGWSTIKQNSHTLEVVAEVEQARQSPAAEQKPVTFDKSIEIRDLHFSYDGSKEVIDGLSFTINKGDRLAIKGHSGAGKSTLLNILLGFYPPAGGSVRVDGVKLDDSTGNSWRGMVGYVPQEVYLLEGSLAENIALGVPTENIDREKIARVLEQVQLTVKAASLPEGADTLLGENGCRLSGGERQRVGIARALYKDVRVLFFDEATSAVDRKTERLIGESLQELTSRMPELTIIAVSHRDLPFCDRELVIE